MMRFIIKLKAVVFAVLFVGITLSAQAAPQCSNIFLPSKKFAASVIAEIDAVLKNSRYELEPEKIVELREIILSGEGDSKSKIAKSLGYSQLVHTTMEFLLEPILVQGELAPPKMVKDKKALSWAKNFSREMGLEFGTFSGQKVFFQPVSSRWNNVKHPGLRAVFIYDLEVLDRKGFVFSAGFNYGEGYSYESNPAKFLEQLLIARSRSQSEFSIPKTVDFKFLKKIVLHKENNKSDEPGPKERILKILMDKDRVSPYPGKEWNEIIQESELLLGD